VPDATPAAELLAFLRAAGFAVTAADGKVFVRPRERLSPAECGQIAALKGGLLELLAGERWERCTVCMAGADPALVREANGTGPGCGCPRADCHYGRRT
jgi:hypothetical protein